MHLLGDILTYIRRIIKSPSNAQITDNLLIDYVNRFYISDVDARIQLFDLKTKYSFQTTPGVDQYNMPLYNVQTEPGNQTIGMYPVYQGFLGPAYINGVQVSFQTQQNIFYSAFPNIVQNIQQVAIGNGTQGPYTFTFPITPNFIIPLNPPYNSLLRGHVDLTGIIDTGQNIDPPLGSTLNALIPTTSIDSKIYITSTDSTGANIEVRDSGQFLTGNVNYGMLMQPGKAPFGNLPLYNGGALPTPYSTTQNTINYLTGTVTNLYFNIDVPAGVNINAQCYYFQGGLPRSILFFNNCITLRAPPATQYLVELDAYLSPCAFLNTNAAIPFGYMAEYIARGAARKILADTGDIEQFMFYETLFKEQESLVHIRSQRQWTATRTQTIYSGRGHGSHGAFNNGLGGGY